MNCDFRTAILLTDFHVLEVSSFVLACLNFAPAARLQSRLIRIQSSAASTLSSVVIKLITPAMGSRLLSPITEVMGTGFALMFVNAE